MLERLLDDEAVEAATIDGIDSLAASNDTRVDEDVSRVAGAPRMTFECGHEERLRSVTPLL